MLQQIQFIGQMNKIEEVTFASDVDLSDLDVPKEDLWGFEGVVAQTQFPNGQHYQFLPESMSDMVLFYGLRQPVRFQHVVVGAMGRAYGRTIAAAYDERNLVVQAYIQRGLGTPAGPYNTTDEMIEAIKGGSMPDLSAGVNIKEGICSICGNDYANREVCPHVRGEKYPVKNETGQDVEATCVILIKRCEPFELSIVDSGSDPEARVINKGLLLGRLAGSPVDVEKRDALLSERQQSNNPVFFTGNPKGDNPMTPEQIAALQAELSAAKAERDAKETELVALRASKAALDEQVTAKDAEIVTLKAAATENESKIKDGETAREKAIEENIVVFSKTFPDAKEDELKTEVEEQKAFLETVTLEKVYANTKGYAKEVDKLYAGGRQTTEGNEGDEKEKSRPIRHRSTG